MAPTHEGNSLVSRAFDRDGQRSRAGPQTENSNPERRAERQCNNIHFSSLKTPADIRELHSGAVSAAQQDGGVQPGLRGGIQIQ